MFFRRKKKNADVSTDANVNENQIESYVKELEEKDKYAKELQKKNKIKQEKIDKAVATLKERDTQIAELKNQLKIQESNLFKQIEELKESNSSLKESNSSLKESNSSLKESNSSLKESNSLLKTEVDGFAQKEAELNIRESEIQAKIDELTELKKQKEVVEYQNIFKDIDFDGELRCAEDVVLRGQIRGNVVGVKSVYIDSESFIEGGVKGEKVVVSGEIHGGISADESLEIMSTGVIHGDIYTKELFIKPGGVLDGRCNMVSAKKKQTQKPISISEYNFNKQEPEMINSAIG